MRERIEAWDRAAQTLEWRGHIHPAGGVSDEAYERSGRALFDQVRGVIGDERDQSIIDFGCGDGRLTVPLACYYHDVLGVDSSMAMLRRLEARAPIPMFCNTIGDTEALRDYVHDHRSPDAVVCIAVLIHHTIGDGLDLAVELASLVRPGGKLVLWVPVYEEAREAQVWNDLTCWAPEQLVELVARSGGGPILANVSPGRFTPGEPLGACHSDLIVLSL